jgi:type VI secretion system protein ImpA
MSTAPTLDIEGLLAPISSNNPSGKSLRYTATYDAIQEARRADEPDLNQGEWKRELKVANWREVNRLSVEALTEKSKDIQLAVWLTESLVKQYGFAGLRDGLRVLRGLNERFWDTLYPEVENDDLEFRGGPINWLNDKLPSSLRALGLTRGDGGAEPYSWFKWQESRTVDELGRKDPKAKAAAIAEGKLASELFDKAVAVTPKPFYDLLAEDLSETYEECAKLETVVDKKFGRDAPSLLGIRKVLEDCRSLVEDIAKKKIQPKPENPQAPAAARAPIVPQTPVVTPAAVPQAPVPTPAVSPAVAAKQTAPPKPVADQPQPATSAREVSTKPQQAPAEATVATSPPPANNTQGAGATATPPSAQRTPIQPLATSGPVAAPMSHVVSPPALQNNPAAPLSLEPRDRADALRRLQAIAAFFRQTEPQSPVACLVQRAARWAEMPLDQWLSEVITDKNVLAQVRATLGLKN